ncbi:MAG TPA: hypothetical protein VEB21_20025 [Terriglobales bacterium]|nr:hypothetical protein [Terriglobales bacterium]
MTYAKLSGRLGAYVAWRIILLTAVAVLFSALAGRAEAQTGCCQFAGPSCDISQNPGLCQTFGGQFFANRGCDGAGLCSVVRSRRPIIRPGVTRNRPLRTGFSRPALPVRPHGPHVTLVPAPLATPTPGPISPSGCCQLPSSTGAPLCSGPVDDFACISAGGVFVLDSSCDPFTRRCNPPPSALGCCQLGSPLQPFCSASNDFGACSLAGGIFVNDSVCTLAGSCAAVAPRCGNSIVEVGEQCEFDSDCRFPIEGCTDTCECVGGVEVLLRWTNYNDLNLEVTDPRGNVYVPPFDANRQCGAATNKPEEFVFLPPGRAPIGCYTIRAEYREECPASRGVDTHIDIRLSNEGYKSTIHDVPGPEEGETFVTTFGVRASCF